MKASTVLILSLLGGAALGQAPEADTLAADAPAADAPAAAASVADGTRASVQFMLTQQMARRLRELGHTEEAVRAHRAAAASREDISMQLALAQR